MITIVELATLMAGLGSLIAGITSAVKLYLEQKKPSANSRKQNKQRKGR